MKTGVSSVPGVRMDIVFSIDGSDIVRVKGIEGLREACAIVTQMANACKVKPKVVVKNVASTKEAK